MICVFSLTEIKISHIIFLSSNWAVNQSSEITCQIINTLILVVKAQTLSLCVSLAASKIFVSENWKKVSSCEVLALKNQIVVSIWWPFIITGPCFRAVASLKKLWGIFCYHSIISRNWVGCCAAGATCNDRRSLLHTAGGLGGAVSVSRA